MKSDGQFAAQLLETSAAGYAGLTAALLLERLPEIAKRYEPDGFSAWKGQLQRWLLDLSAAVAAGEPKLFEARMLWTRAAFVARQASVEDLQAALEAMRDMLRERLPADSAESAISAVDRALQAVAGAASTAAGYVASNRPGRSALTYLETILEGKPREAIELLLREVDGGTSVRDAYLRVLIPAQQEVGRMWHAGEMRIAEEHVITTTTRRAMALLCERGRASLSKDRTAVLAAVAGNVHDIGICVIADFFEMAGWRAVNLGPDVPAEEIARSVRLFDADVVLLSATLDPHLKAARHAIERVRALEKRDVKIIVGGLAFETVPDLWRKFGADGHANAVEETEPLASRLTGS